MIPARPKLRVQLGEALIEAEGLVTADLAPHANLDAIRQVDVASTELFVREFSYLLTGRVLDFGAGVAGSCRVPQPYRHLVERPGVTYCAADLADIDGHDFRILDAMIRDAAPFDSILCTQVFQYLEDAGAGQLGRFAEIVPPGGRLIMTYATNWDEVEKSDRFRCTRSGMEVLLTSTGWLVEEHRLKCCIRIGNFRFPIGYGVVARRL